MAQLKGIEGWLLIPTVGLILSSVVWAIFALGSLGAFWFTGERHSLGLGLMGLCLLGFSAYTIHAEFTYQKKFVALYLTYLYVCVALSFAFIDKQPNFGSTAIGAILWTFYMAQSKRVKNTFVK